MATDLRPSSCHFSSSARLRIISARLSLIACFCSHHVQNGSEMKLPGKGGD